jgi:hypothetical protein
MTLEPVAGKRFADAVDAFGHCAARLHSDGGSSAPARFCLLAVQAEVNATLQPGLAALCVVGCLVLESSSEGHELSPGTLDKALSEILTALKRAATFIVQAPLSIANPGTRIATAAIEGASSKEAALRLSLKDGKRLGEILLQRSLITKVDLERALRFQTEHGLKLGQALVQMELISDKALEVVLRSQTRERGLGGDLWATRIRGHP